jgi:hypothetical protein
VLHWLPIESALTEAFGAEGRSKDMNKLFLVLGKMLFGGAATTTQTGVGVFFGLVMFIWAIVDIISFFS